MRVESARVQQAQCKVAIAEAQDLTLDLVAGVQNGDYLEVTARSLNHVSLRLTQYIVGS